MGSKNEDKVVFDLPGVCACFVDDLGAESSVVGVLAVLEKQKSGSVVVEWRPFEVATPEKGRRDFGVELKELRSVLLADQQSDSDASLRLLARDGTNFPPLRFTMGGCADFLAVLQRFCMLKRSTRQPDLLLVCDERAEALQQSVSVLFKDNSADFLSRLWANPYAAAVSGLGRVGNYLQDHVLPNLLLDDFEQLGGQGASDARYAARSFQELLTRDTSATDDLRVHSADDGFEVVQYPLPARPVLTRDAPLTRQEWEAHLGPEGRVLRVASLLQKIFRSGIEAPLRKTLWPFLLGVHAWDSTEREREAALQQKRDSFYRMKLQWRTLSADQLSRFADFRERQALIDKDVARTDRKHDFFEGDRNGNVQLLRDVLLTHVMFDFDLGYVQGMSDLLSPLLVVLQTELDAFWAFVGLMARVKRNFDLDQRAVKEQLFQLRDLLRVVSPALANHLESHDSDNMYFCFRWILVLFKREFSFADISTLWEVLWTDLPCKNFHLLVCVAILDAQKDMIIENRFGFTEVLKHVNELSMRLQLRPLLVAAEGIFHQLAASRDSLPRHVCDHLAIQLLDASPPPRLLQPTPRPKAAPGSVRRVDV